MDVLNEQQLRAVVVDPAITRLNTETIPAAQKAMEAIIEGAVSGVIRKGLDELDAALTTAIGDVHDLVNSLDGWTLEIAIPPITIRLSKPVTK